MARAGPAGSTATRRPRSPRAAAEAPAPSQGGGAGGGATVILSNAISGGAGGGGGGGTEVVDQTAGNKVLLDAGGGGGGGGDYPNDGSNGGFGADAGSPIAAGNTTLGNGYAGVGRDQGVAGGSFAPAGHTPSGGDATPSSDGTFSTGGGGGGGTVGGGAGGLCGLFAGSGCISGGGGGGGAGGSSWPASATNVVLSNSLPGDGGVMISWIARAATTTTITSDTGKTVAGAPVTLTATVATPDAPAGYTATGSVTFVDYETGLPIGLPVPLSNFKPYTASTTVTSLPLGTDHVYASYSGDVNFVPSTSAQLAESITPGVAVTTTKLPDATAGTAYHTTLTAAGGKQPYHWKTASGPLPAGLTLNTTTGVIAGTPSTTGAFPFTVTVTDSTRPAFKASAQLRINVNPKIQPAVYVVNGANTAVHSYSLGASGNIPPLTTLAGATTGLNGTSAVAIAPDGRVFVASANNDSIRVYPYGATGDVKPAAVIAGDATGLASPQAIVLDGDGRLYVANATDNSVTVYAPAATGNAKPIATLKGAHTGLANPAALTIDGHGRLWVANLTTNSLTAYPTAADGDMAPSATIGGAATQLNGPHGLALDSSGNLLVADTNDNSITEYSATDDGNLAPAAADRRTIHGPVVPGRHRHRRGRQRLRVQPVRRHRAVQLPGERQPNAAGGDRRLRDRPVRAGPPRGGPAAVSRHQAPPARVVADALRRPPAGRPRHHAVRLAGRQRAPPTRAAPAPRDDQRPPAPGRHLPLHHQRQGRVPAANARLQQLAITVQGAGQPPRRSAHHAVASRPIRQPTRTVN